MLLGQSSLGLSYPPRTGFKLVKLCIKKIRRREQGDCQCKMGRAGFHSVAKLCAQMFNADHDMVTPRIATISSLNLRADCHNQQPKFESGLSQSAV
jgi:hypothetical protein